MRRFTTMTLLIITASWLSVVPVAVAQEYAVETGDLDLVLSVVLTISGDGPVEDSVVLLTLIAVDTDDVIALETLETDATGGSSASMTLPAGLEPGTFSMTATGLDLTLALQHVKPGFDLTLSVVLTLSGDGFVEDSIVLVSLVATGTGEVTDLGTLETDSAGAFSGSITLPSELEPGMFTLTATGVTQDGATRILSADVSTIVPETTGPTTTAAAETTTTTSVTITTVAESTTTLTPGAQSEPATDDSDPLVLVLIGVIVALLAVIGGQWWQLRRR